MLCRDMVCQLFYCTCSFRAGHTQAGAALLVSHCELKKGYGKGADTAAGDIVCCWGLMPLCRARCCLALCCCAVHIFTSFASTQYCTRLPYIASLFCVVQRQCFQLLPTSCLGPFGQGMLVGGYLSMAQHHVMHVQICYVLGHALLSAKLMK